MFRSYLIIFSLFVTVSLHGQTYKDDIRAQFFEYTDFLIKKDFERSVDYLNPALFTLIPKAQLVKVMEQTYNNPNIDFEIQKPSIVSIEDKKNIDGKDYVKLEYSNYLRMRFKSEDGKRKDTSMTKNALEKQFGHGKVTYDAGTDFYRILVNKNVIASSADNKKWTFVVVEDKQKQVLERILPKELL